MDGLLRLWERIPLPLRIGFAVFSGLMTILGLPSVGNNVADWGAWLSIVGSTVGAYVFPLLGLFGLVTLIGLQIAETRARKAPAHDPPRATEAPRSNPLSHARPPTPRTLGSEGGRESPLAAALVHERRNGRKWLSGLGVSAMASMFAPRTTEADVLGWEASVRYLLRDTPDLLVIFDYDSPEHSTPLADVRYMTGMNAITGGKLAARLRRQLARLDKIIEGL